MTQFGLESSLYSLLLLLLSLSLLISFNPYHFHHLQPFQRFQHFHSLSSPCNRYTGSAEFILTKFQFYSPTLFLSHFLLSCPSYSLFFHLTFLSSYPVDSPNMLSQFFLNCKVILHLNLTFPFLRLTNIHLLDVETAVASLLFGYWNFILLCVGRERERERGLCSLKYNLPVGSWPFTSLPVNQSKISLSWNTLLRESFFFLHKWPLFPSPLCPLCLCIIRLSLHQPFVTVTLFFIFLSLHFWENFSSAIAFFEKRGRKRVASPTKELHFLFTWSFQLSLFSGVAVERIITVKVYKI